jgi:crossover junction endonuclease EME1
MTVEVINLLSSPDLPRPAASRGTQAKATLSNLSKATVPTKALTCHPEKRVNDASFAFSSDDIGSSLSALPYPKPTSDTFMESNFPTGKRLSQYTTTGKSGDDFWILSDDSDGDHTRKSSAKPLYHTSGEPKTNSTGTVNPPKSRTDGIKGSSGFFLSDDIDSTVNLDDPFSELQPAKKRRLSSSPRDLASKTIAPKRPGYQRSHSNIESSTKAAVPQMSYAGGWQRSKTMGSTLESDPIVFTSSPDPFADAARQRKGKQKNIREEDKDEDIFALEPSRKEKAGKGYSSQAGVLKSGSSNKLNDFKFDEFWDDDLPEIGSLASNGASKTSYKKSSRTALAKYNAEKTAETEAREKAQKALKGKGKEAEKEQKRLAREEKAREKEKAAEVAKVNTLRTDKKFSAPEMIVDLGSSLESKLSDQVRTFLGPLQVEHSDWSCALPVIKWRRKVVAVYNNEIGHWEPTAPHIKAEKHVMYVMSAKEFVDLATGGEGQDLDAHVLRLNAKFESCKIIHLIEGLTNWMRKNKNVRNKQYTAAVRNYMIQEEPSASQRTKKGKEPEYVDENMIEDALLRLQVIHGTFIHHTSATVETAQWVIAFTQHISTIPYRYAAYPYALCPAMSFNPSKKLIYERLNILSSFRNQKQSLDTAFCMESGQVKTGDNPEDTYAKMLQEIIRITASVAYGITAKYPTVQKLVKGLQENGPLALEDCRKSANKDGAFTDRRIGPAISKRVYKVFMSRDAGMLDI